MRSNNPDIQGMINARIFSGTFVATPSFQGVQDATILDTDVTNPTVNPAGMCRVTVAKFNQTIAFGPIPYPGVSAPPVGADCTVSFVPPPAGAPTTNQCRILSITGQQNSGSNTAAEAQGNCLVPTFANGAASRLSDLTKDYMVYLQIGTAGTALAITIGHDSTTSDATICTGAVATAGTVYTVRLPAGWYLKWAATTATLANQSAVPC